MKVISELPLDVIDIYCQVGNNYYNPIGLEFTVIEAKKRANLIKPTSIPKENVGYLEESGDDLIYNPVICEYENDTLIFKKSKNNHTFHYNEKYNELENYDITFNESSLMNIEHNQKILYRYVAKLLQKQEYYQSICSFINLYEKDSCFAFKIFGLKANKNIPLLLETGHELYVKEMIKGDIDNQELLLRFNKKILLFAKKYNLQISLSYALLSKYKKDELEKFIDFCTYFKIDYAFALDIINMYENIDFSKFLNYLVKSIFVSKNISLRKISDLNTCVLLFLRDYRDYLNLIQHQEHIDLYPEDLETAANAAADNLAYIQEKMDEEAFKAATAEYANYAYKSDNWEVVIPSETSDLIKESEVLHHCVKTYVKYVISKQSKICLIRKDGNPYMTVEVRNNSIIQAKKIFNNLPDEDDINFLKEWSYSKNLIIEHF